MTRWLAFGLTGQVGRALQDDWRPEEARIVAVTRGSPAPREGIDWVAGDLGVWRAPAAEYDAVVSVGPLDAFARWYDEAGPAAPRVVALGSTSVHSKGDSPEVAERDVAIRLAGAEDRLTVACAARGATLTLLRPTLIYGVGGDRNLSRIVEVARRWRWLPLPWSATGRRQPVHAADVAGAVLAALRAPLPCPGRFDLPGGETLRYDEMVRRTLAAAVPAARVVRLPDLAFRAAVGAARRLGHMPDAATGILDRLSVDLVYDAVPVRAALGIDPRPFTPEPFMFEP